MCGERDSATLHMTTYNVYGEMSTEHTYKIQYVNDTTINNHTNMYEET